MFEDHELQQQLVHSMLVLNRKIKSAETRKWDTPRQRELWFDAAYAAQDGISNLLGRMNNQWQELRAQDIHDQRRKLFGSETYLEKLREIQRDLDRS